MKSKIQLLKKYFKERPEVIWAFIFGSRSKNKNLQRKISDWDIAVYFKPKEYLELETEQNYPNESKIQSDLINILETDNVDFLVLNRARPSLVYESLRSGIPLAIKNKKLYLDILCKTRYEAMDWWNFVYDYWKIGERSKSLHPKDRMRILEHLKFLENEFKEIQEIKKITWQNYLENSFDRRNIERWVENLVMASLDIAEIILASDKKNIPESYKDTLKKFVSFYINNSVAEEFSEFAGLRNIVTHRYLDIKWKHIKNFVERAEKLYPIFIKKSKKLI